MGIIVFVILIAYVALNSVMEAKSYQKWSERIDYYFNRYTVVYRC